jgi:hypothetical protein
MKANKAIRPMMTPGPVENPGLNPGEGTFGGLGGFGCMAISLLQVQLYPNTRSQASGISVDGMNPPVNDSAP